MEQRIQEALTGIERRENVRILYAAESGSRAWGFASPDSDYDVRFVYVRPAPYYLKLEAGRDVLELPMDGVLDVNGWDLDKTLRLLHASNPTLFEWFSSPVVYRGGEFTERFRPVMERCFRSRKSLWHYLSMAKSNCGEYLKGEQVKLKKYFYVLRPLLACRWILEHGTPPPMAFRTLAQAELPPELHSITESLLKQKIYSPETAYIPPIDALNAWLENETVRIQARIEAQPSDPPVGWEELNALFLSQLGIQAEIE